MGLVGVIVRRIGPRSKLLRKRKEKRATGHRAVIPTAALTKAPPEEAYAEVYPFFEAA